MPLIAGVDEAGRGPLAGPVVAAAVILPENPRIDGVRDSKQLSPKKREDVFHKIMDNVISVGIGIVHEDEIDRINIFQATFKAMRMALGRLKPQPDMALIDGKELPDQIVKNKGVKFGDRKIYIISAASIIAKVTRDRLMLNYDRIFPDYYFARHKGYATKKHIESLKKHFACPIHRKTFKPVREYLPSLSYLKKHRLIGKVGEQLAACKLVRDNYEIIEMNYNASPYGEIDIIARNNDTLVFVEVKTVTQEKLGEPELKIDDQKIEKLERAFEVYLQVVEDDTDCRFDVMTVFLGKGRPVIKHYVSCLS
ncbi:MAG: ribonuclease HII [Candidatus Marinimicrobia bacterium]|nr:ribonuclease HII [Candidatus Neomarinimicrobiota bacterium]